MNIDVNELIEVVNKLNDKIFNDLNNDSIFELHYSDYYCSIFLDEFFIWSSEEEEREFNDELNEYEDLYLFCIKKIKNIISKYKKIVNNLEDYEEESE